MGKKSKKQPQEELGEDERAAAMAALLEEEETTVRKPKAKPKAKKGKKQYVVKDDTSDDEDAAASSSGDDSPAKAVEEEEVSRPAQQQQQQQQRGKKAKKNKGKGRGRQDDSDDDDAEVDEDLAALMQGPKGGKKGGGGGGRGGDSDDDDQPKGRGGKKQKQKQKGRGKKQADSDEDEDAAAPAAAADADAASDEEEDAAPVVPTMQPARGGKKAKKNKGKGRGRQDDSDDDDDVDEDLAALMQGPKGGKKGGGGGARGGGKKKAEAESEDEEEDEPAPTMQPARGGKKAKKGRGGRAAAGDSDGEEEPAAAAKPQAKKGKKKKADDDYMAMMLAEEPEEDEEDKHRREMEEKARKAQEEKDAAEAADKARKAAEEKAAREAEEAAKREAEEAAQREAEETAAREAEAAAQAEAAQKAEEEAAARKAAEEKAAAAEAEAEAAQAKEAEANAEDEEVARRRAESERKRVEREAEKAKRKAEREKKKAKKSGGGGGGGDSDDDGLGETNEEGGGLTRKERKEREKRKEFEEKFGKVNADGRLRDSPYTIVMSEDQWNVEDNARDIRFDGVSIAVPGKELFKNTSLKIIAGHRYGLIGPNGWGKSTVLQLFARGELPVPKKLDVLLVEQEQEVDEDVLEETCVNVVIKAHKKRIAYMAEAEKLRESGDDLDRLQELEDELHNMGAFQAEAKARKILGGLGFPSAWQDRKVSSFSGGWRKRVALSCAVFMEPDVLLLDEPTNHLDLNAVIWLETYLPSVYNDSKKKPKSLVVVSHDVSFLEEVCSDTIHIENKKLNEYRGNYQAFLQQVQLRHNTLDKDVKLRKDYEKELSRKGLTKKEILKKVQERFAQKGYDEDDMPKKRQEYQVTFPWEKPTALRESYIVKCEQMKFRYRDDCPWIFGGTENKEGVNFSVWTDSRIALVGPNGCGKTTLIQILDGKLSASEGYVEQCRQVRVGRYSQHFVDQLPLEQNAVNYLIQCGVQTEFKARAKLGAFGLEGKAHLQEISTLSGGQKVRVAFAGISAAVPHVLLLDEPTNHLDMESIQALADSLNEFTGGVLVITHDARLIQTLDADLWVVENSNVVKFNGDLQDYREHLVEILGLEEERKALDAEKLKVERAIEKASNMDADERARLEAKKAARRNKEDSSKKQAEDAAKAEQDGALAAFLDKPKKDKKEKKDKEEKKEKKDKEEKKEKKDKEDKKEKKEKKDKKDKKEK